MFDLLSAPDAGWHLTLYTDAGEAGGGFRSSVRTSRLYVPAGYAADPMRARTEAARRARAKLRRYVVSNRLDRFGTLTYRGEGCFDSAQVALDVGDFFRRLRSALGGTAFPYAWVPEWHQNHGLHVHFAVGRYVGQPIIAEAWGRGFVSIKRLGGPRVGASTLEPSRIGAGYLAKYLSKTWATAEGLTGRHRYEVARGFQPAAMPLRGDSAAEVLAAASDVMGRWPMREWVSSSDPDWQGPPVRWYQWA